MHRETLKNAIARVGLHHILIMCPHCMANVKKAIENDNDVILNDEILNDTHIVGVCHDD